MSWVADERQGRGSNVQRSKRIETSPRKLGAPKDSYGLIGRGFAGGGSLGSPSMDDALSSQVLRG